MNDIALTRNQQTQISLKTVFLMDCKVSLVINLPVFCYTMYNDLDSFHKKRSALIGVVGTFLAIKMNWQGAHFKDREIGNGPGYSKY